MAVHPDHPRREVARALVAGVVKRLAERITAMAEKDHLWAMAFWETVRYRTDGRIIRRVRHLRG